MAYKYVDTGLGKAALLTTKEEPMKALSPDTEDALMHYGVIGMKWGVRRYQDYGEGGYNPKKKGKFIKTVKKNVKKAIKNAQKPDSTQKKIKKMSDEELEYGIKRLKKEHEYRELLRDDANTGIKVAKAILLGSAVTGAAGLALVAAGKLDKANIVNGKTVAAGVLSAFGSVVIDDVGTKVGKASLAKSVKDTFDDDIFKVAYSQELKKK